MPKALVEIGGVPVVRHVIDIYLRQGFDHILLATGYRGELVAEFAAASNWPEGVRVEAVDTGVDTPTGGRIAALADRLDGAFCVTYADGLADIDLAALLARHRQSRGLATVTVIQPQLPWGVADIDRDGTVRQFIEKPQSQHWVNGGFFCFEAEVLDFLTPDSVLEREPLEKLAAAGQLAAYRHPGFWECMDTYKDAVLLNDLWHGGAAPWLSEHVAGVGG